MVVYHVARFASSVSVPRTVARGSNTQLISTPSASEGDHPLDYDREAPALMVEYRIPSLALGVLIS